VRPGISALIIAKDEQEDLAHCLISLAETGAADEVVVLVDAASSDKTEELARRAGAKVAKRAFDDYARQRQAALDLCSKDWVLWIDADERVDGALGAAIAQAVTAGGADAFPIRFSVEFMGRELRFGGLGSEKHVRLFRRAKARFSGGEIHEGLEVKGVIGEALDGLMIHRPYKDLSEYVAKMDRYTSLAAQKKRGAGLRFSPLQHLVLPWELFKRVVLRGAFLDGTPGLVWAGLSAFHHWLKYAKLRELER
jgi:glycosyltransferase involved in cell wall biosynthesis